MDTISLDFRKSLVYPTPKLSKKTIDDLYLQVKETLGKEPTMESLPLLSFSIMQKVETFKTLDGEEKKKLVIYILYKLIEDITDEALYKKYEETIESVINSMIDLVVNVDKHKVTLKKKLNIISNCFEFLSLCLMKK